MHVCDLEYWCENLDLENGISIKEGIEFAIKEGKGEDANWFMAKVMNREQRLKYAIYAADLVLPIFEKECPEDFKPRQSIEAAKICLENDTKENKKAAGAAADAARGAGWAASCAGWAAGRAARYAGWAVGRAARCAAEEVDNETIIKILRYGVSLLMP